MCIENLGCKSVSLENLLLQSRAIFHNNLFRDTSSIEAITWATFVGFFILLIPVIKKHERCLPNWQCKACDIYYTSNHLQSGPSWLRFSADLGRSSIPWWKYVLWHTSFLSILFLAYSAPLRSANDSFLYLLVQISYIFANHSFSFCISLVI